MATKLPLYRPFKNNFFASWLPPVEENLTARKLAFRPYDSVWKVKVTVAFKVAMVYSLQIPGSSNGQPATLPRTSKLQGNKTTVTVKPFGERDLTRAVSLICHFHVTFSFMVENLLLSRHYMKVSK